MRVLASDMDGTFIPLDGNRDNRRDLSRLTQLLSERGIELVYVTGRHFESVLQAIQESQLPTPAWIICDVGTSIYQQGPSGPHAVWKAYHAHLEQRVSGFTANLLQPSFAALTGLRLQETEKLGPFKLSYYCDAKQLSQAAETIQAIIHKDALPYHVVSSVDPFNGDGLIDLLPQGVTKDYALGWWAKQRAYSPESIVFSGDSGNDLAALTGGYRSIVVGNAAEGIKSQVREAHAMAGWPDRLFIADAAATSGVLAGVEFFSGSGPS